MPSILDALHYHPPRPLSALPRKHDSPETPPNAGRFECWLRDPERRCFPGWVSNIAAVETFVEGDVRIVYEDSGTGPAVLCLAPGGLAASRAEVWARSPWNPLERLAGSYRIVAMDQRNTGTSWAPIHSSDGWHSYAADQLSLMDHLGIDRFAVVGMCIGGAFIARLLADAPDRVAAAVAMQPIGFDSNRDTFDRLFDDWKAGTQADHPEAGEDTWRALRENLFGANRLVWSVDDDQLGGFDRPLLVLAGNDEYHPFSVSRRLAETVPTATFVEHWKSPEDLPETHRRIVEFLAEAAG